MFQEPSFTDSWTDLWRKASNNLYEIAVTRGYGGILQPSNLDSQISAMRKCVTFSAYIGENP